MNGVKLLAFKAVKPTTINSKIAKTFRTTSRFSTRAARDTPREISKATRTITTTETRSTTPPSVPKAFDNEAGSFQPSGANNARKFAESPDPTKASAMKYSASSAQPATQPKNSPNTTLIHEYAEPAKGIAAAISA